MKIVLVAYMVVLGYLATRALRQVPAPSASDEAASVTGVGALTDTRLVYDAKSDRCRSPLPTDLIDSPQGSFDV